MKRILLSLHGFSGEALFDPDDRDGALEPFIRLRERLHQLGYALVSADDHPVESAERILCYDVPQPPTPWWRWYRRPRFERDLVAECRARGVEDRLALVLLEPEVIHPANWLRQNHRPFSVVFTWSDDWVDPPRYRKLRDVIPTTMPALPDPGFAERALVVMLTANKSSPHPRELYSARRAAIRYLDREAPGEFALYGPGWRRQGIRTYRGTVPHKWEVHPHFRFSYCYENMLDVRGLVSERIFDCMRAHCVPIYWGAPNVAEYVDPACFVDRRAFADEGELLRFLRGVTEREYRRYREAIAAYLESPRFRAFLPDHYADTLIDGLGLGPAG